MRTSTKSLPFISSIIVPSPHTQRDGYWHTIFSSSLLHAIPIAPWATAGSMSSMDRIEVTFSVMFRRFNPANANNVAWTTPSFNFFNLVCTLPRKFSSTWTILPFKTKKEKTRYYILKQKAPSLCQDLTFGCKAPNDLLSEPTRNFTSNKA